MSVDLPPRVESTKYTAREERDGSVDLPDIASGPRRRSSGTETLASQFCRVMVASDVASAIVQPASTKQPSSSSNVTKSGTARKHSCNECWPPQAAASASMGAFWRTHVDLSDIALAIDDEPRRRLSSVTGSAVLEGRCMVDILAGRLVWVRIERRMRWVINEYCLRMNRHRGFGLLVDSCSFSGVPPFRLVSKVWHRSS